VTANRLGRALNRLSSRLEHAEALDAAAAPLDAVASRLTSAQWMRDLLSGTPVGHPVHPLLVTVPIGSWTAAMALDCVHEKRAARTLVGLGLLAATPAAMAGLHDWRDTSGAEHRVGLVHAALNSTVVACYAASWVARRRGRHGVGVALSVPGMALLAASGWLGGHMSYALGVGVDTTAFQNAGDGWVDAIDASEVEHGRLGVGYVNGVPVLVTRLADGTVVAYADRCTHRGGPLNEGEIRDDCVVCPWHGSQFSLVDGQVMHGPATRPQPVYEARVTDGRVELRRTSEPRSLRTNPIDD
jgi:nitrite reductase/ring-hydroxylating ferredoxin subunit/uncharacterized membrane protein